MKNLLMALVLVLAPVAVADTFETVKLNLGMGFMDCQLDGPSHERCDLPDAGSDQYEVTLRPERFNDNMVGNIEVNTWRDGWDFVGHLWITKLGDYETDSYVVVGQVQAYGRNQVLTGTVTHVIVGSTESLNNVIVYGVPMGIPGSNFRYLPGLVIGAPVESIPSEGSAREPAESVLRSKKTIRLPL